MKKWKLSTIGNVSLIPIVTTMIYCSAAPTSATTWSTSSSANYTMETKIKQAGAKQFLLDYYNNLTYTYRNSAIALMNYFVYNSDKSQPIGINSVNNITLGKLSGTSQNFKVTVSPTSSGKISPPNTSFSVNIDLNTHIISYPAFKSITLHGLGNPLDTGGDVTLVKKLIFNNFSLLKQIIFGYFNIIDTSNLPKSLINDDAAATGREINYVIGDNIYSIMTIKYTTQLNNKNKIKFLSVWNKKTGITTIPELQSKIWS